MERAFEPMRTFAEELDRPIPVGPEALKFAASKNTEKSEEDHEQHQAQAETKAR